MNESVHHNIPYNIKTMEIIPYPSNYWWNKLGHIQIMALWFDYYGYNKFLRL
jgi:hypothetical protein